MVCSRRPLELRMVVEEDDLEAKISSLLKVLASSKKEYMGCDDMYSGQLRWA